MISSAAADDAAVDIWASAGAGDIVSGQATLEGDQLRLTAGPPGAQRTLAACALDGALLWAAPRGGAFVLCPPSPAAGADGEGSDASYVLRPRGAAATAALGQMHAACWRAAACGGGVPPTPNGGAASAATASGGAGAVVPGACAAAADDGAHTPTRGAGRRDGGAPPPPPPRGQQRRQPSAFDARVDPSSADLYFHYYGMLQHQQNMLQDAVRTGTYHAAIAENAADFAGKAVLDVGAGSGILSLFAAAAGARMVYAVEASAAAGHAAALAAANAATGGGRVVVLRGRVEDVVLPERVDVLLSEPMGTLLLNERMLESYVHARDRWLRPGGALFPRLGRIHVAAFSDATLHAEVAARADFWAQRDFYGVDLSALAPAAAAGYFAQVVVDEVPPGAVVSDCATKTLDFASVTAGELADVVVPLSLTLAGGGAGGGGGAPRAVHGVACWFDVLLGGSAAPRWLSTAPGLPATHWFQLRCVLAAPLAAAPRATLTGELRLVAHARQSYDIHLVLRAPPAAPGGAPQESRGTFDLKEPYYRQFLSGWGSGGGAGAGGGGEAAAGGGAGE